MARPPAHPDDPRHLIGESYRIEGIGPEDCRAIFFDWALGLPADRPAAEAAGALLAHHKGPEDHPMTGLLRQAMEQPVPARGRRRRRG